MPGSTSRIFLPTVVSARTIISVGSSKHVGGLAADFRRVVGVAVNNSTVRWLLKPAAECRRLLRVRPQVLLLTLTRHCVVQWTRIARVQIFECHWTAVRAQQRLLDLRVTLTRVLVLRPTQPPTLGSNDLGVTLTRAWVVLVVFDSQ